jgi:hypothetical protein
MLLQEHFYNTLKTFYYLKNKLIQVDLRKISFLNYELKKKKYFVRILVKCEEVINIQRIK